MLAARAGADREGRGMTEMWFQPAWRVPPGSAFGLQTREDNEPQCVGGRTIAQCKLSFVAFGTPNGLILRWRSIELSSQPLSKQ